MKAALLCLGEVWPGAVAFDVLLARSGRGWGPPRGMTWTRPDKTRWPWARPCSRPTPAPASRWWSCRSGRPASPPRSARPAASPLARLQAESTHQVTNLRHEVVSVTPFDRQLLPYLDGTRDRPALVESLLGRVQRELMQISQEDQPVTDPERARAILAEVLEQQLPKLAQAALLLA